MSGTELKEFSLPDLGEGLTESEILSWKVSVGDHVALNQVIAEVETAKAVVELPSPYEGTVAALHEQPGTVVAVGAPIVSFTVPADSLHTPVEGNSHESGVTQRVPTLVGYGAEVEKSGRPSRRARRALLQDHRTIGVDKENVEGESSDADIDLPRRAGRPRCTPPVRKLARDLGVDLEMLTGTGPSGLIIRQDVSAAAMKSARRELQPVSSSARETRTPIKGVRKRTASAMVSSAFTAPHVTEFLTVDATDGLELLARLKGKREYAGYKLTPLTLVAKAVLVALSRNPSLNSTWDENRQEIVHFNYVNLGIAAATPRGLIVPNIKDAETLSLTGLSKALSELAETARGGKTSPAALAGGTITITNIGVFGIDAGTPILNPGEAAILAVGSVRRLPWEHHGEVALRSLMTLSLSFDHRLVDGEQASTFLADVGSIVSEPSTALVMM
ncbi:Dihydrolipoyllysine-residue acetyltransferase component of pyruvate dehydrogenase complex [Arthrobacter sp. 9V]|uniref:dihydrolipoamide acetyltransferase family protein n=1 Tax=Arthrobacter sp. 9V TaxID=2653132 RepID=UPI0012EF923E|nr:dihydrolipoamide acetyltransferase family protein [Arthrobacter sp. 9V]VXB51207.1 Dihydrolipoyllysine-residue acetyltransferase component of pyruvate dehydrogenase complex [Arthrobacter sp. 9V]